jgi:predicted lipoprotein
MSKNVWLALAILGLGGCRIVSQQELTNLKTPPNPDLAAVAQTWQQKLVPQVVSEARPVNELLKALQSAKDFDRACQSLGWRAQQENPCVFAVRISGVVEKLDTVSRSGKITIRDSGGQIVVVQIGPTIRGTALRDGYKGVSYQDFNDQVLFGDYGRAINDLAVADIQRAAPKAGEPLRVEGVFTAWDLPQAIPEVTPARISRQSGGQ